MVRCSCVHVGCHSTMAFILVLFGLKLSTSVNDLANIEPSSWITFLLMIITTVILLIDLGFLPPAAFNQLLVCFGQKSVLCWCWYTYGSWLCFSMVQALTLTHWLVIEWFCLVAPLLHDFVLCFAPSCCKTWYKLFLTMHQYWYSLGLIKCLQGSIDEM